MDYVINYSKFIIVLKGWC